jgi:concentrative nucleoside transporter, CNT family
VNTSDLIHHYGYNAVSFLGLFVLMGFAWLFSANRWRMNWRAIAWGTGMMLMFGALVFCAPGSTKVFGWANDAVNLVLGAATAGQTFVFGDLANKEKVGFVLATQAFPIIIFVSALMSLLYYWRIMPLVIRGFAFVFTKLMRISGAESLCTSAQIFAGIESNTTILPYLSKMTRSEFCTVLTAGMATVATSTLGLYVGMLGNVFHTIAGHLISASILGAPASIVMSKIIYPEDGVPMTLGTHVAPPPDESSGPFDAIINGAMAGVKMVVGIVALLIAFLGIIALINLVLTGCGLWPLERIMGAVMQPFAMAMGVPPADAGPCGQLLGERLVMTEVPAYQHLAQLMAAHKFSDPRTAVITAYALCGFAHVASLAIFVGGTAALVPSRRADIVAVGPRALLAATLACFMMGAVAGVFFTGGGTVLQK